MSGQGGIVGKNCVTTDVTVMRNVDVSHDPIIATNLRSTVIVDNTQIDSAKLAHRVTGTNLESSWLPAYFLSCDGPPITEKEWKILPTPIDV
jgi:hypothetical protein